jgi:flagellar basal-body rod modification protein FlgD
MTTVSSNLTGLEDIVKATSQTTTTTTQKTLGKDDFLKMLLAQLKNQDPLKPMEGTEFASQLAQFSSLEQLSNLTSEIKSQSLSMSTMAHAQAVGMIGKDVVINNSNSLVADGKPIDISYKLDNDAASVIVSVLDKDGKLVKTIESNDQKSGQNSVTWDASGVSKGNYTFQVTAKDINGNDISASLLSQGTVTAVQFKQSDIYVIVNGQELPFSDVTSVSQKS